MSSGDDTSYLSHAFTIGLDFDLDYRNEPALDSGPEHLLTPSGAAPAHPVGPGLMAAPFVTVFSLFDRLAGNPVIADHLQYVGSWSYFGFFIAVAFWFLFGAWLYMDAFEAIGMKASRWTVLLFASATGISFYVLFRPTMGHAFEFAAAAMVFWGAIRFFVPPKHGLAMPEIAMVAGILLTLLVRPADTNILILPPAVWGLLILCGRGHPPALTLRRDGTVFAAAIALAAAVWIFLNLSLYGVVLPSIGDTYGNGPFFALPCCGVSGLLWEGIRSLPLIWPLLTSSEFGLLYSAPILPAGALAVLVLLADRIKKRPLFTAGLFLVCAIYAAVPLAVVLLLKSNGESYGFRYLYDLLPLCLLGVFLLFDETATWRITKIGKTLLVLLSLWSLIGAMFVDASAELGTRRDLNAFGRSSRFSMVGYEYALAEAVVTPGAWFNLAARRLPGFVAARFVPNPQALAGKANPAPGKAQAAIARIKQAPGSYFFAIIAFWLLYPLCIVFVCEGVPPRLNKLLRRFSPTRKP